MKLYKTIVRPVGLPAAFTWQASQTEASKARAELKRQGHKPTTETVEVPTAKGPLIEWLNLHAAS